ncbi:RagB/SusD family nutrient uptake outer membrane protein [Sphingobacterium yanglingense]|uniref:SusD-like starch-binding protein associating with outer membrane n=1 Tax=Sphingobacterium yanglingense TaxID=1437280 RepID=A0A4R6WLZ4_9SPHI|nr:RagB/SusD family nutrient uptake outer membrane protein [Sphingobacterium yanglingense]TDQ79792.1 SusD-like starch-binding protein associating with outer membrane [Sphingobacterium yanglingense]
MKKKLFYTGLCFLSLLSSCEKFLDEKPLSVLTPENAYNDLSDWKKTLNGAYAMLQAVFVGKYTITLSEFGTDEVIPFDMGWAAYSELHYYTFNDSHPFLADHYRVCYEGIKRSNVVIDIPEGVIDNNERTMMIAQAKFLRAIYYFDLVRMYGGVPLWTKSSIDRDEIMKPRVPQDKVYELIVQDLKDAENVLPTKWTVAADVGRATKYAVQAMLARVYLQWKKPEQALSYCNALDGKFRLYDNLRDIFDPKNKNQEIENIFEVQFKHSGAWGMEGSLQHSYWGPRGVGGPTNFGGWGGFGPTQYVYDSYEPTDKRRQAFFLTTFNGVPQVPASNYKFFDSTHGNVIEDDNLNFVLIRYADVLLMKAEALNLLGDASDSKYDALNTVRRRAGINPILATSNLTQTQFADVLLKERLHELCFEHLRRWDLIRFGKLKETMKISAGVDIQDYHNLYPIPKAAMDANEAIKENNPGY